MCLYNTKKISTEILPNKTFAGLNHSRKQNSPCYSGSSHQYLLNPTWFGSGHHRLDI